MPCFLLGNGCIYWEAGVYGDDECVFVARYGVSLVGEESESSHCGAGQHGSRVAAVLSFDGAVQSACFRASAGRGPA